MSRRGVRIRCVAAFLLAGFGCGVFADTETGAPAEGPPGLPPGLPLPDFPPAGGPPVDVEDPYWAETVDRALANAGSENPEVRRSAVMLLGKYPVPRAEAAVVDALEDPDDGVRQAALVSLFENRRLYQGQTAVRISERVADPNVGIRRIAANVLPMVIQGFPLTLSARERRPVRELPDGLESTLLEAFRDEDVTVRRNMISHFRQLYLPMPDDLMAELLRDPDREVAIEALDVVATYFEPEFLARHAPDLTDNPDRLFRLNLVRHLDDVGHPGAREALKDLREDEDTEVALSAFVGYYLQNPRRDVFESLVERLRENPGYREIARRAIDGSALLGSDAIPFLEEWMDDSDPDIRYEATQRYFLRFHDRVGNDRVLALLKEDSQALRQVAFRFLRQHPDRVSSEILETAAQSPRADVRGAAVPLSRFVPRETGEAVLRELLLDGDADVRVQVLREMASRRVEGWEEILALSLSDNNAAIQQAALGELIRQVTPETLRELRAFLEREPDSRLRPTIEQHLARQESRDT